MTTKGLSLSAGWGLAALVLAAIAGRLAWMGYTRYTAEDAFITFRYAYQLAAGNGFVHNTGERVYGTTTPLYTLLLAGWLRLGVGDVATGANFIGLMACGGMLIFTWLTLRRLAFSSVQQAAVLCVLGFSIRLITHDTRGMETPLVLCGLAASWWALACGRTRLAGVLCGLLLWTRPDVFLWPLVLAMVLALSERRKALELAALSGLVYLPWLAFAAWYFGSPIPHTVIAKWTAYLEFNSQPAVASLPIVWNALSPFYLPLTVGGVSLTAWLTAGLAGWQALLLEKAPPAAAVLPIFALLEIAWLVLSRATFFSHYLLPPAWAVLILLGLALGSLWQATARRKRLRCLCALSLGLVLLADVVQVSDAAGEYRLYQQARHEQSLKAAGLWLNAHTPPDSMVLLEPLGYVGFYADRRMRDEVGLVSPEVVAFKRQRITDAFLYAVLLQTDYWLIHCDDADGYLERAALGEIDFDARFTRLAVFNPLGFDPATRELDTDEVSRARDACYEIWGKNTAVP